MTFSDTIHRLRHWKLLFGGVCASLLVTAAVLALSDEQQKLPDNWVNILAPCTIDDDVYRELFLTKKNEKDVPREERDEMFQYADLEQWQELYHTRTRSILESFYNEQSLRHASCTDDESVLLLPEDDPLYLLARKLPPWQETEKIRVTEIGAILLEHLRIYECGLQEMAYYDWVHSRSDVIRQDEEGEDEKDYVDFFDIKDHAGESRAIIDYELDVSRKTLELSLSLIAGKGQLSALDAELTCLQRTSLDIRNQVALASEASACLERVNGRDALTDIAVACNDGKDNDGDGQIDFGSDRGCNSPTDTTE